MTPRRWNGLAWLGSTRNRRHACEEIAKLLVGQWDFTVEDAFIFLSVAGDRGIAQYCHPSPGSVVAKMRVPKTSAEPWPFKML